MADEYMITLYRVALQADTISTAQKVEFNKTAKKTGNDEAAFVTRKRVTGQEGIGDNQSANSPLSNLQALSLIEKRFVLEGWIRRRIGDSDDGQNAIINLLQTWEDGTKQDTVWPEGRFGIQVNDKHADDVVPVNTGTDQKGLILESIDWDDDYIKRKDGKPVSKFIIILRKSRGDGT